MVALPFVDEGVVDGRRTFMVAAAANLVAVPLAGMAQQAVQIRRIGYLAIEDEAGSGLNQVILPALRDRPPLDSIASWPCAVHSMLDARSYRCSFAIG